MVRSYNPSCNIALIEKAYEFGKAAHDGQFRKSGEPYFNHPVEVAKLLTEIKIDDTSIITALLHDTIEDTGVGFADVEREFSLEIAELVNGVTKLTNLQLGAAQSAEVENLRKLLVAISKDVRVLLVKLADRLHNMRTIKSMKPEKQRQKARETMDIYAPLAGRMGMQFLREELEDLSFQVLNPTARESILRKFVKLRAEHGDVLPEILGDIREVFKKSGIDAVVTGREKRPHSIWRKIQNKGEGFERLSDIYGFRVITNNLDDCYRALGSVHTRWAAIPGRFKDFISQPKSNGYRSIHTTVTGRSGRRVEFQIRTHQMHVVAQSGIAAHWSYKDGAPVSNPYKVDPTGWLNQLNEGLIAHEDDDEFIEHFKLEMYHDQVFVFSPKGKVVSLPRGATAIDFAYAIHTNIGNHAVGALIDGQRMPLSTPLRNGQTIHITQADAARPQENWGQVAKTGRARAAIKRAFKTKKRDNDIELGRSIAEVSLSLINKNLTEKILAAAAQACGFANSDALLEALGRAEITGKRMIAELYPEFAKNLTYDTDPVALPPMIGQAPAYSSRPGQCCLPVPGDRIIGIAKKGHGILYHVADCHELSKFDDVESRDDDSQWVDLKWPNDLAGAIYPSRILATMANDTGVLGRVCTIIGENHANIERVDFVDRRPDYYSMIIELSVRDVGHLSHIISALKLDNAVSEVIRHRQELSEEDYLNA